MNIDEAWNFSTFKMVKLSGIYIPNKGKSLEEGALDLPAWIITSKKILPISNEPIRSEIKD